MEKNTNLIDCGLIKLVMKIKLVRWYSRNGWFRVANQTLSGHNNQLLAFVWQSHHPTKILNQKVKFARKSYDPKGFS